MRAVAPLDATRIELIDPLACPDWDRQLQTVPGATFFHGRGWAHVLHEAYGFAPAYFVAHAGERLTGVLPLLEVDSWLSGRRGVGLPFTDACPPIGIDATIRGVLVRSAWEHGRARNWKYCEIRGGAAEFPAPASVSYYGHELDLTTGATGLLLIMDSSFRRAVRKAERNDVRTECRHDLPAVRQFHELMIETRRRHGLPPQPLAFFEHIHRHILARGQGVLVMASHRGRPVAGALFLHFGQRVIFKYGASTEDAQSLRPNNLVMWRAIEWHANAGFSALDFGRTDLSHEGLRRFKLGWGAREFRIDYIRRDLRRDSFSIQHSGLGGWPTRVFRHLPAMVSRFVGAALYRHVA